MPVKPIFGTYPYLRITEKFGLNYGDVLMVAEFCTKERSGEGVRIGSADAYKRIESTLDALDRDKPVSNKYRFGAFMSDIGNAVRNFHEIQQEGWDQS